MLTLHTRIFIALGESIRSLDGSGTINLKIPALDGDSTTYVESLLTRLTEIDEAISKGLVDSMAKELDGIKVDFSEHLALMRHEGSLKLSELARFTGLPLVYDKYTGRSKGSSRICIKAVY